MTVHEDPADAVPPRPAVPGGDAADAAASSGSCGTSGIDDAAAGAVPRGRRATATHYVLVRHRHNWEMLFRFGLVGGSGVLVNLAVFALAEQWWGAHDAVLVGIPATEFNVRAYHAYSTLAFVVANFWNYLLNRRWTFRSHGVSTWRSEYVPFLLIGVVAQVIALGILTVLLHEDGVDMDHALLAQAITIVLVTPISFLGNKLWTFRAVRQARREASLRRWQGS